MPLNPAEAAFFAELAKQAEAHPQKPLMEQSIDEIRAGCGKHCLMEKIQRLFLLRQQVSIVKPKVN